MSTITQFPSGNTLYRIEFDYLARTFVVVTLVNSSNPTLNRVLEVGRDYRFLNPTMIEMLTDQSGFDIVRIHRQTGTDLVVDFRNGSVLTASDLTNAELQAIHIAEEGRDQTVDLAKEYADAAGDYAGNAKDSEDEARRIAESIKEAGRIGYITRRSFEKGFNITTWNEVLLWEEGGDYYRWDGPLPKNVPAGSTPGTTGEGAWVSVGDAALRSEINKKLSEGTFPEATKYKYGLPSVVDGAVFRNVQEKLDDLVNASDFALVGDGTDESEKMQNAVNAAIASKSKTLYIGSGTYKASDVEITSPITIIGSGRNTCEIQPAVTGSAIFSVTGTGREYNNRLSDVVFKGITFSNPGAGNPFLIVAQYTNHLRMEQCTVYHGVIKLHVYYYPTFYEVNLLSGTIYCESELNPGEISFDYANGAYFDRIWSSSGKIEVRNGTDTRVSNSYLYNGDIGLIIEIDDSVFNNASKFVGGVVILDNLVCECKTYLKRIALSRISGSTFGAFNGTGLTINGAREIYMVNSGGHYNNDNAIHLINVRNSVFSGSSFTNAVNSCLLLEDCHDLTFTSVNAGFVEVYE